MSASGSTPTRRRAAPGFHWCFGDHRDRGHECSCKIGHDHSASYHRQRIADRDGNQETS